MDWSWFYDWLKKSGADLYNKRRRKKISGWKVRKQTIEYYAYVRDLGWN